MGLQANEICELIGGAYGRVDAPLLFFKELIKVLFKAGFKQHPLDPCVFILERVDKQNDRTLHGVVGTHVDDGIGGGDSVFEKALDIVEQEMPFGSRKHRSFVFTGIQVTQLPDFSIRLDQSDYVDKIQPIEIGRIRRQQPASIVTEIERQGLRGINGSLQYAAVNTRPDLCSAVVHSQTQENIGHHSNTFGCEQNAQTGQRKSGGLHHFHFHPSSGSHVC